MNNININKNKKQRIIWSNIYNRLNISLHEQNLIKFINVPEIQTRFEKFLSFYTEGVKGDNVPNLKFLDQFALDQKMKDFLCTIADSLNMTREKAFELLDNYFYLHIDEHKTINIFLNIAVDYQDKASKEYYNILLDIETYKTKILEFYFEERKNLILFYLDLFKKVFLEIENTPLNLRKFLDEFIVNKKLIEVFYKQIESYEILTIFDQLKFNNQYINTINNNLALYISEEQNLILELIMILLKENKYNTIDVFEGLFNYFLKTQFNCYSNKLRAEYNQLKKEIMNKALIIILSCFQPNDIYRAAKDEKNAYKSILCLKINFQTFLKIYDQPRDIHIMLPLKMTIQSIKYLLERINEQTYKNIITLLNEKETNFSEREERECFGFLNYLDDKTQELEGEMNPENGPTIYDVYYDILYEWLNMIMILNYGENIESYPVEMNQILYRVLNHVFPQIKFYLNLQANDNNKSPITKLFLELKNDGSKRCPFLNLCFALSKSIEPGEGSENNEYLLNILSIEPIEKLRDKINECNFTKQEVIKLIETEDNNIFFNNIYEEWNKLVELLYQYYTISTTNPQQYQNLQSLPEELLLQINYIRLFIRAILPKKTFSKFIFYYSQYFSIKEKYLSDDNISMGNDNNENDFDLNSYNPEIFRRLIFYSVNVLCLLTEMQNQNKNLFLGDFINDMFKLFIVFAQDNHFTECLKQMNPFFEKFNGKNIIYNIIYNDYNSKDFSNTLYAVRFIKHMFNPNIFIYLVSQPDYNKPIKQGETFYISNFYYIKELTNHFTQINDYLSPQNALLISELGNIIAQTMSYLEFKNCSNKIQLIEGPNIQESSNLESLILKLLMQDDREYSIEEEGNNNITSGMTNSLLLNDFIFKYISIKINDNGITNPKNDDGSKNIFYNNTYIQMYLNNNNIKKDIYNDNYQINCYEKMILSLMNCFNKLLSLIILAKENETCIKYNQIHFLSKLKYAFLESKEIPHYIYESINEKKKYDLNIILLMLFYSIYETEKNEQLIIYSNHMIDLNTNPSFVEYFVNEVITDKYRNISTISLNNLTKIIYIIRDSGININNYFFLQKISLTEINSNINLFQFIRKKLLQNLNLSNEANDLLKIEIIKFLTISVKYQYFFLRDFIKGDDNMQQNENIFLYLLNSLQKHEVIFKNKNEINISNNEYIDYNLNINIRKYDSELFTYIIIFVAEILNEIQDIKIIESLLVKDYGDILIKNLIRFGTHSCNINDSYDEFISNIKNNNKKNLSDIFILGNTLQVSIDVFCLKLNIFRALCIIYRKLLLYSKESKQLKFIFKYNQELYYFLKIQLSSVLRCFSLNDYDITCPIKNVRQELLSNNAQFIQNNLNDKEDKNNLEMLLENYLFKYDFNYSFDIKELIMKGFIDLSKRNLFIQNIMINNCYICYYYLLTQSLIQSAHLFGLIFSIGEYNFLLTTKLYCNNEIYKIFYSSKNNNNLKNSYLNEINSLLSLDNCYNYKLTFNPLEDLFNSDEKKAINFIDEIIFKNTFEIQNTFDFSTDDHRLYYEFINCGLDYIIYLYNRSEGSESEIKTKIELFEFLSKVNKIISNGVINNLISNKNLLSLFNLVYHIIYYFILTEKSFNSFIDEDIEKKIQNITELMEVLIIAFKKIKELRSIILYLFSSIVFIKNNSLENPIYSLFNIIIKLYSKDTNSFEFQSFLLLLNRLKDYYPTVLMNVLKDSQIFHFISIQCGYDSDANIYDSQLQVHTPIHLIYCWTLKLFTNILHTYLSQIKNEEKPNYSIVISNTMKFAEITQQRFRSLFNVCSKGVSVNEENIISLAYLDELNATLEFICVFIDIEIENASPNTKDQSFLSFLFDSVDLMLNNCLYLFQYDYKNITNLCKPKSNLERLMNDTKISSYELISGEKGDNNNQSIDLLIRSSNKGYNNLYQELFSQQQENSNNKLLNRSRNVLDEKITNVFYYKVKANLSMILFHLSSCVVNLLNRQNFNLKQYLYNKYQQKENEKFLNSWPLLYLNSITLIIDFLKDILINLEVFKLLYNKSVLLLNSCNVSLSNCFYSEINNEYPLNELVDILLFILIDFTVIGPNLIEFIEIIVKNHPFISGVRDILGNISQLLNQLEIKAKKYNEELEKEESFLQTYSDLVKCNKEAYKIISNKFNDIIPRNKFS